jgi:hypothetical protein
MPTYDIYNLDLEKKFYLQLYITIGIFVDVFSEPNLVIKSVKIIQSNQLGNVVLWSLCYVLIQNNLNLKLNIKALNLLLEILAFNFVKFVSLHKFD